MQGVAEKQIETSLESFKSAFEFQVKRYSEINSMFDNLGHRLKNTSTPQKQEKGELTDPVSQGLLHDINNTFQTLCNTNDKMEGLYQKLKEII